MHQIVCVQRRKLSPSASLQASVECLMMKTSEEGFDRPLPALSQHCPAI
jgi:hypothetical protein